MSAVETAEREGGKEGSGVRSSTLNGEGKVSRRKKYCGTTG